MSPKASVTSLTDTSPSSIKLTIRDDLSLLYRITRSVIRPWRPRLVKFGKPLPQGSPKLTPPDVKYTFKERQVQDIYLYDFEPPKGNSPGSKTKLPQNHIYYFAGGGFQSLPTKDHWKLCTEFGKHLFDLYNVTLVSYPLAPNSPASDSIPRLQKWLKAVCAEAQHQGTKITLMGDSAGGNIALGLAFWWATQDSNAIGGAPLSNVLVISPATDLRNENPDIKHADKFDPILTIEKSTEAHKVWIGDWPVDDTSLSPNTGDFVKLKESRIKIHGIVGTHDILAPDAIIFRKLCAKNGIEGEWLQWEGQMHCFPLTFAYGIYEGIQGKDWIIDVLKRNA